MLGLISFQVGIGSLGRTVFFSGWTLYPSVNYGHSVSMEMRGVGLAGGQMNILEAINEFGPHKVVTRFRYIKIVLTA